MKNLEPLSDEERSRLKELRKEDELDNDERSELDELEERNRMEELSTVVAKTVGEVMDQSDNENRNTPEVNGEANVEVKGSTADSNEAAHELTERLLRGVVSNNEAQIKDAQRKLYQGGHYKGRNFDKMARSNDGFNTLIDDEGGIFLPTTVANQIFEKEFEYGVVSGNAVQLPIPEGRVKVPNLTGELDFFALVEGNEMKSRKVNFGGIELDPLMWGLITPWTLKMEAEAGGRLMPVLQRKIASASAKIKDDVFINGDGTSTFHNIKGLSQKADDGDITLKTANNGTSFSGIAADDYLMLQKEVFPAARPGGVYVAHPDRKFDILRLKDNNSRYYYLNPSERNMENATDVLWGKPVLYTEKAWNTDGSNKKAIGFFNPEYLAYGVGAGLTTDRLTEATIQDTSGNGDIKLGSQYSAALRVVEEFDLEFGLNDAFAVMETGS